MNIEKLIAAAKEIDRLSIKQEARTRRYAELASMASNAKDATELRHIQEESRELGRTVVDFGDALNDLRRALKAKPTKIEIGKAMQG